MSFLANVWQRIGTKLYVALGFAVCLTLISSTVGVYYFEQSGDLNYLARSKTTAVLESAWNADRRAEQLLVIARDILVGTDNDIEVSLYMNEIGNALDELDAVLQAPALIDTAAEEAQAVQDAAYDLAEVTDTLVLTRDAVAEASAAASGFWARIDEVSVDSAASAQSLSVLRQALLADNETDLRRLLDEFGALRAEGISPEITQLAEGQRNEEGLFDAQFRLIVLRTKSVELSHSLNETSSGMERAVSELLSNANAQSISDINSTVISFDQGRLLLAIISLTSVTAATLTSWLWVGNGMVRRLSRMSERMRNMARGDLETPVPEVGKDEIGELAEALEVFRQQALEVQRLNLVEKLYGELREANEEMRQMQARLVAQEKLAALGELVSGVAHEISNPLNFVNNFSEGSVELYEDLSEILENYKSEMSDEDLEMIEEISIDISDSLRRVRDNGVRALTIVERMRSMGMEGGVPTPVELNVVLPQIINAGCEAFEAQWSDFTVKPVIELDSAIKTVPMVEHDFGEALVNLVSNACYAMRMKRDESDTAFEPDMKVSSRLSDDMVEVSVYDNGVGIADDVVEHIFNPFFTTRDGSLGAGLGLSIAADVARRLGGYMTVDTVPGEYSNFTISIPASEGVST